MGEALVLEPETVCTMSPHSLLPVSHHRVGILLVVLRLLKIMLVPEKIKRQEHTDSRCRVTWYPDWSSFFFFLLTLF